jgi:hypothetical protein
MVAVTDLRIGRKYEFQGFAPEEGSHPSYIDIGVGNWTGWLIGINPNLEDESTWTLFLRDDEGCDLYFSIGSGVYDIFQRPEPQKVEDELTAVLSWVCNLDEEENEENNNEGENNEGENNGEGMNNNENSQRRWGGGGKKTRSKKRRAKKTRRHRKSH